METTDEIPPVQELTRRLGDCPQAFVAEPMIGEDGQLAVDALVWDLVVDLGGAPLEPEALAPFRTEDPQERNWLRMVAIAAWLCHHRWFRDRGSFAPAVCEWLKGDLRELASVVDARDCVSDSDRREELVRRCLTALDQVPPGETRAEAEDRLATLDSVERARVLEETEAQRKRAEELRQKMNSSESRESAAKPSREF